ncbi:hypothetical protein [Idiomarina xiamenensis]|uniref:PEGA domain-containing protein n=1 Tax=Idiomarina xiamenensis 10-D-4 TaxID=740709 RepID=K2KD60_9GAMM|nr:hypothetical protein [Idiomarina xiamenensis]EKE80634.1 hypothetical protein A10D4_11766 [Idiomarina xiamenensis 10-D-4]
MAEHNQPQSQIDALLAEQAQQQRRRWLIAIAVLLLLLALLSLGWLAQQVLINSSTPAAAQQLESSADASAEKQPEQALATPDTGTDEQQAQRRQQFMQQLPIFEQGLEAQLTQAHVKRFAESAVTAALAAKQQALVAFANGDYEQALQQLGEAREQGKAILANWQQTLQQRLSEAQQAFASDQVSAAQLALEKALLLDPDNQQGQQLQQRIAVYPEVSRWLDRYRVAEVENNLSAQIDALTKVLALDPARQSTWQQTLSDKRRLQQQQQADSWVTKGVAALQSGDLTAAEQAYQQARQQAPQQGNVQQLGKALASAQHEQQLQQQQQRIQQLIGADDWRQVQQLSASALQQFPNNSQLQLWSQQAQQLNQVQQQLDNYNARPQRLTDSNIQQAATDLLATALPLMPQSARLQQAAQQLAQQIDQLQQPVAVTVISDNRTDIRVLGTGVVGTVDEKVIQLKPGRYTLEGRRDGYRSKRVTLALAPGQEQARIELICDERI